MDSLTQQVAKDYVVQKSRYAADRIVCQTVGLLYAVCLGALKNDIGAVRDGEADFVVLAPELGLAVIEVKGSKLVRVDENGIWAQAG